MLREPNATFVALAEQVPTSASAGADISNKHEIESDKQHSTARTGKAAIEENKRLSSLIVLVAFHLNPVSDICEAQVSSIKSLE